MSLTSGQLKRLEALENSLIAISKLVKGASSKNQLNRLLVLAQKRTENLTIEVESLQSKADELLELVRRLQ